MGFLSFIGPSPVQSVHLSTKEMEEITNSPTRRTFKSDIISVVPHVLLNQAIVELQGNQKSSLSKTAAQRNRHRHSPTQHCMPILTPIPTRYWLRCAPNVPRFTIWAPVDLDPPSWKKSFCHHQLAPAPCFKLNSQDVA
ncbi:hypothetical protein J3459_011332 [Metarhizium acridum]|nr:hypothetical protein J3459_011332 [Metarhizium acridum]